MKRSRPRRPEEAAALVRGVVIALALVIGLFVLPPLGGLAVRAFNRGNSIPSVLFFVLLGSCVHLFRRVMALSKAMALPSTTLPEEGPGHVLWSPLGARVRRFHAWRRRAFLKAERDQREAAARARDPGRRALIAYESAEGALDVPDHFIDAALTSRIQWVGPARFEALVRCLAPALPAALRITGSSMEIEPPAAVESIAGMRDEMDRLMRAFPSAVIGTTRSGVVILVPRGLERPEDVIGLGGLASDLHTALGAIDVGYRGGGIRHEEIDRVERATEREVAAHLARRHGS